MGWGSCVGWGGVERGQWLLKGTGIQFLGPTAGSLRLPRVSHPSGLCRHALVCTYADPYTSKSAEAGEMVQLRVVTVLAEDSGSVPSTHGVAYDCNFSFWVIQRPLLASAHTIYVYI